MNITHIFPTPIANFNIDIETCNNSIDAVKKHLLPSDDCNSFTNDDLHTKEEFANIVSLVDFCSSQFCEELGVKKEDLKLTGMWANLQQVRSVHHTHHHPNSFLSGVLYLQIPECSKPGDLILVDPRTAKSMQFVDFQKESAISNRTMLVKPHTGLLILFPSWLEHGTDYFVAEYGKERISLSFNYSVKYCSYPTMKL